MDIDPISVDKANKKWFKNSDLYPIIVYETENDVIAGWASLSQWSPKEGYKFTTEISVYVHSAYQNQGIGKKLIKEIIKLAKEKNFKTIVARIDESNEISIKLHSKLGFETIGIMKKFGYKFDKFYDIRMMQILI